MPVVPDSLGLPIAIALGVLLFGWYLAGNELMRRRAHRLAIWGKRAIDPLGGTQRIRWLSNQAFRLEVDDAKPPFSSLVLTGLIEAWDVPFVWAWNRLHGRRDLVLLQLVLRSPPRWGLEVYRPGSVLAGDAHHFAHQEEWTEAKLDGLIVAAGGDPPRQLAAELVAIVADARPRLVRLALRRQGTHLTLALDVPDPAHLDPHQLCELARRLAQRAVP